MTNNDVDGILAQEATVRGALRSFPKSPAVRAAFRRLAQSLCDNLRRRGVTLEPDHVKGLVVKLGKYSAKRQWDMAAVEAQLPTMADAITEAPQALADGEVTLQRLVDRHRVRNQQAAADVRRALLADPQAAAPPAIMAQSRDGAYQLVECVTQRHLRQETATLGHCVGGTHLDYYRDQIARGAARIFSLRTAEGMSVATIEYDTKTKAITQIEGSPRVISERAAFFGALCQTLHALTTKIPVGPIEGLPQ